MNSPRLHIRQHLVQFSLALADAPDRCRARQPHTGCPQQHGLTYSSRRKQLGFLAQTFRFRSTLFKELRLLVALFHGAPSSPSMQAGALWVALFPKMGVAVAPLRAISDPRVLGAILNEYLSGLSEVEFNLVHHEPGRHFIPKRRAGSSTRSLICRKALRLRSACC